MKNLSDPFAFPANEHVEHDAAAVVQLVRAAVRSYGDDTEARVMLARLVITVLGDPIGGILTHEEVLELAKQAYV